MSTRAIIGIENSDGTIIGAWQWNDGMGLASLLKSQFDTLDKVQELIKNGVWNNIVSPEDIETLKSVQSVAIKIIEEDSKLENEKNASLKKQVDNKFEKRIEI